MYWRRGIVKQDLTKNFKLKSDIRSLIDKYKKLIERIEDNMERFPEEKQMLTTRKNVYMDLILDLTNILNLNREDADDQRRV